MQTTKIYVLTEPDGTIRYIGKTKVPLSLRLMGHLSNARKGQKNYRCNWIRSLMSKECLPSIMLIGEVEGNGIREEVAWIAYGRSEGMRLTNTTDGGDGLINPTAEVRKRMSESQKRIKHCRGYKHSEEVKQKQRLRMMGKQYAWGKRSEESKRRMSIAQTGKKRTEEQKRQMSILQTKLQSSPEYRHRMSLACMGKKWSEESKRKMSISMMGNKNPLGFHRSEEERRKIRDRMKGNKLWQGRKHTKETIQKMSTIHKALWANK